MFNPEGRPREPSEEVPPPQDNQEVLDSNQELENSPENPEQVLGSILTEKEKQADQDPSTPSWVKRHKKGLMIAGGGLLAAYELPKFILFVTLWKFAKSMSEGNMTFKKGYDIGKDVFSLGEKGDDKK